MENVYRIILSENINIKKGYINVSIKGSPVIKNEPVDESKPENEAETQAKINEEMQTENEQNLSFENVE